MGILDSAKDFLGSDKGEELSDQAILAGQDAINKATGDKYAEQLGQAAQAADSKIGNEGARAAQPEA